ncbi:MAG: AMP-binding protein [Acidimicrobiales bacterium]
MKKFVAPDLALEEMTVAALLQRRAQETPTRMFLRFGEESATFAQVHDRSVMYANAIARSGVQQHDYVALMMVNSLEYVYTYFGLARRGVAVVLVNTAYRGYMLEHVLIDAGVSTMIVDADLVPVLIESLASLPGLRRILIVGATGDLSTWEADAPAVDFMPFVADAAQVTGGAVVTVDHADAHCVVYSSGTTGPSKGIVITNAHAVVKAIEVLRICHFTADDVLYSPLPLFYSMGLLRGVLSAMLVGSTIVLRDRFSVTAFWDDVRATGATVAHCVFSLPEMLKTAPAHPRDGDNSLRCMFNARHDPEFEERFGLRCIESYGLTEAGNAIYSRIDEPPRLGSCGRVSEEWDVLLADPQGREVPVGDMGEILIRPRLPHRMMIGYLNQPEATVAATRNLWLHTGDLASVDAGGYYTYRGRLKEVIRRRGQNISAWEVEKILSEHPAVRESAAYAFPSPIGEDDLRVSIVAHDGVVADLEDIAAHCARRMPPFMVPRYYEFREDFPRTPSGRIQKHILRDEELPDWCFDRERVT